MLSSPAVRLATPRSVLAVLALSACAGAPSPPPAAPGAPATAVVTPDAVAEPAAATPPTPATMPTACAPASDPHACPLPDGFVDALCNATFPDATLALFAKGTPWVRAYLRGDVDGWYAGSGGSARTRLAFDEEVLVLRTRAPATTGIVVGNGATGYDVLRWDGFCYSLGSGELTMKRPPKARRPPLAFHRLSEATQTALLQDDKVRAARSKRGKECKGAMTGDVTLACERADRALGEAVADYVVSGAALPPPAQVPGG